MSGGSFDYAYLKVENIIRDIEISRAISKNISVKVFKNHLQKIVETLRVLEWYESGDSDDIEEVELSIQNCIGESFDKIVLDELKIEIENLILQYNKIIKKDSNDEK